MLVLPVPLLESVPGIVLLLSLYLVFLRLGCSPEYDIDVNAGGIELAVIPVFMVVVCGFDSASPDEK